MFLSTLFLGPIHLLLFEKKILPTWLTGPMLIRNFRVLLVLKNKKNAQKRVLLCSFWISQDTNTNIKIFQIDKVQAVILRCLNGLYLNRIKSYVINANLWDFVPMDVILAGCAIDGTIVPKFAISDNFWPFTKVWIW